MEPAHKISAEPCPGPPEQRWLLEFVRARTPLYLALATERNWSREKFLEETCAKAGLPRDAWKQDARLEAFTSQGFSED